MWEILVLNHYLEDRVESLMKIPRDKLQLHGRYTAQAVSYENEKMAVLSSEELNVLSAICKEKDDLVWKEDRAKEM